MDNKYNPEQVIKPESKNWLTKKRAIIMLATAVIGGAIAYNKISSKPENTPNPDTETIEEQTETNITQEDLNKKEIADNSFECGQELCINNYDEFLPDLPGDRREALNETLYKIIKRNLKTDDFSASDAKIRPGSVENNYSNTKDIHFGSFIVDIKSVKQSYLMTYQWSSDKNNSNLGGYTATAECINKDKLKFGDFNCEDDFSKSKAESKRDPIIKHLPYSTFNYVISANTDKKGETDLNVEIILYSADTRNDMREKSIEKYKKEVIEWIKSKDLNPNDYNIYYTIPD